MLHHHHLYIHTCCDMCSSCIVDYFMCVPSYCEVCTHSICCRVDCAPPVHRSGAALAAVALAAVARTVMATAALGLVRGRPSVPVSSVQFSRCSVAFVLRLISYSPRRLPGARLYSGLRGRRTFTPLMRLRRPTCSGGTGRDRSGARGPSSAPPGRRGCSSGPC